MAYEIVVFSEWEQKGEKYCPVDSDKILKEGVPEGVGRIHSMSLQKLDDVSSLLEKIGLDGKKALPSIADFEKKGPSISYPPQEIYKKVSSQLEKIKELLGWNEYAQKLVDLYARGEWVHEKYKPAPGETVEDLCYKTDMWMLLKQFLYHWEKGRYVFYNPPAR